MRLFQLLLSAIRLAWYRIPTRTCAATSILSIALSAPLTAPLWAQPNADGVAPASVNDNSPRQPPFGISLDDATVVEGGIARFVVRLPAAVSYLVGVDWATASGTARASQDYIAERQTLRIRAGATSAAIEVQTLTDAEEEGEETFQVRLLNTYEPVSATGTILDPAPPDAEEAPEPEPEPVRPNLTLTDATITEGGIAWFVVRLSQAVDNPVSVEWITASNTAKANQDYNIGHGTLIIPAGETTGTIAVQTQQDQLVEGDETFRVQLLNTHEPVSATGTILDDDHQMPEPQPETPQPETPQPEPEPETPEPEPETPQPEPEVPPSALPSLTIADTTAAEGSRIVFAVQLAGASEQSIAVDWTVEAGTATANADYVVFTLGDLIAAGITSLTAEELRRLLTGGTLTIPAGQTRATISIRTLQDQLAEGDETLQVVLSNPAQATLAKAAATGTILDDD